MFTSELSTWKKWAPLIHPSLLNNSISFHPHIRLFVQFMAICWTVYHPTEMQISWSWRVGELFTPHTQRYYQMRISQLRTDINKDDDTGSISFQKKKNDSTSKELGLETWKTRQNPWIFSPKLSLWLWESGHEGALLSHAFLLHYGEITPKNNQHLIPPSFVITSRAWLLLEHKFLRKP